MIEFIVGVGVGYVAGVLIMLYQRDRAAEELEQSFREHRDQLKFDFDQIRRRSKS